jgi:Methuselah N-terminus
LLQTAEILNNDYRRLPNDSIIYKNLTFAQSEWGYVGSIDHEGRGKNLRVCYCNKVQCIRLCCPPSHEGIYCESQTDENFEIITEMNSGKNHPELVNLKDEAYIHRLVYGDVCDFRIKLDDDEVLELLPVSL